MRVIKNKRFDYDFVSPSKQIIEEYLYRKAAHHIRTCTKPILVTGPQARRHVANATSFLKSKLITIVEKNKGIFDIIRKDTRSSMAVSVINADIRNVATSPFMDVDLTGIKDIEVIRDVFLKQMKEQRGRKCSLIGTVAGQHNVPRAYYIDYLNEGLNLFYPLEEEEEKVLVHGHRAFKINKDGKPGYYTDFVKEIVVKPHPVFKFKILYYNAGGGPMITFLINYEI